MFLQLPHGGLYIPFEITCEIMAFYWDGPEALKWKLDPKFSETPPRIEKRVCLVCRDFRDAYYMQFYRSYTLGLRRLLTDRRKTRDKHNLSRFHVPSILSRIEHFRSNAHFIRDRLEIIDEQDLRVAKCTHPVAFSEEMVSMLMQALNALDEEGSLIFKTLVIRKERSVSTSPLPSALWRWIESRKPAHLVLRGRFTFPEQLNSTGWSLKTLHLDSYDLGVNSVVQALKPPKMSIEYDNNETYTAHRISPPLHDRLEVLDIVLGNSYGVPNHFFNFVSLPNLHLKITIGVWHRVRYVHGVPPEPRELQHLFVDDLSSMKVQWHNLNSKAVTVERAGRISESNDSSS